MALGQEAMRLMNIAMLYKVDAHILEQAIALATRTVGPITDAATANAIVCEVEALYVGMQALPGTKVMIAANTMYPFFKALFTDRITVLGDEVLVTGQLKSIGGWDLVFVDESHHPDPTKVIFAVGKPLDTYIDEAGFSHGERFAETGDPNKIDLNKIYFHQLNIGTTLWKTNEVRLIIAG